MAMQLNDGDKIRILNVDGIVGGDEYWENGDIVSVFGQDSFEWRVQSGRNPHDYYYIRKESESHAIEKAKVSE